jgi:hypothetical protein
MLSRRLRLHCLFGREGFALNKKSHTMSETSEASSYDYDGGGGTTSNAIIPSPAGQPSPGQKLLSSMVLGDGSFEASMKERSRVSF